MKKIKCKLIGIHYTGTHYSAVLEDMTPNKVRLPIILSDEAGVEILSMRSEFKPVEETLSSQLLKMTDTKVIEVNILDFESGVFKTEIKLDNDTSFNTSSSNALYLFQLSGCDLFVDVDVMKNTGIKLDEFNEVDTSDIEYDIDDSFDTISDYSIEDELKMAIENEDFELAAKLRDELNKG